MSPPRAATARTLAGRFLLCTALWMATWSGSGPRQWVAAPAPARAALPQLAASVPVAAARVLAESSDQLYQTGQVGGTMTSVLQVGDFAYVGQGTRVVTFDLSRADRPRLLCRGPLLSDRVMDLAMAGDHVAALLRRQGLVLLDLSRPAEPRLLGQSGPWPLGDAATAFPRRRPRRRPPDRPPPPAADRRPRVRHCPSAATSRVSAADDCLRLESPLPAWTLATARRMSCAVIRDRYFHQLAIGVTW